MGMDTTVSSFFMIMNRDSFGDLTDDQQQIVLEAGKEASIAANKAWMSVAESALADFQATDGKEVITLSADEAAKFNAASAPVVEKVIAEADAAGLPASDYVKALKGE